MTFTQHLKKGNDFLRKKKYDKAFLEYFLFKENNDEIKDIVNFNITYAKKKMNQNKGIEIKIPVFCERSLLHSYCQNMLDSISVNTYIEVEHENIEECVITLKIDSSDINNTIYNLLSTAPSYTQIYFTSSHSLLINDKKIKYKKYTLYTDNKNYDKKNNIVYICDKHFIEPTIVSINSCLKNIKHIDNIFIIAVDCADFFINKFTLQTNNRTNIHIINVGNIFADIESYKGLVSNAALYKFILPYILDEYDSVLYVDSDTLILNDLSNIFENRFNSNFAYITEDLVGTQIHEEHKRIGAENYFNSGVMYLNLEKMRTLRIPEQMIDIKLNKKNIKYMDQDVFNICFSNHVIYISNYYNYMTTNSRLNKMAFDKYFPNFSATKIKILHYTYKKPWNENSVDMAAYWYEEYRDTFKRQHPLSKYRSCETDKFADFFLNDYERENSVLLVEAADCHGEIMPGFVNYFRKKSFNVDVIFTHKNFDLNPLCKIHDKNVRVYSNDKYNTYKFFSAKKLAQYKIILFTSRTLYYAIEGTKHPTIFQYFKILENFKNKILCLEHHLEYIDEQQRTSDAYMVLANPSQKQHLVDRVVNLPIFGDIKITPKSDVTTFIVIGSIEKSRKNHSLLIESFKTIKSYTSNFKVIIVARYGELDIPQNLTNHFKFYKSATYETLYNLLEESDFILPMLDPNIEDHHRYLTCGTSGSFQLIYGFTKPCLIHSVFAECYNFNEHNALLYNDKNSFLKAIQKAIAMEKKEYALIQDKIRHMTTRIVKNSEHNIEKLLNSI